MWLALYHAGVLYDIKILSNNCAITYKIIMWLVPNYSGLLYDIKILSNT